MTNNPDFVNAPWSSHYRNNPARRLSVTTVNHGEQSLYLLSQFHVVKQKKGRFQLNNGVKYEIFLTVSDTEKTVSHIGKERFIEIQIKP